MTASHAGEGESSAGSRALDPRERADDEANNKLFFRLVRTVNLYEREIQRSLGISGIQGAILGELSRREARGIRLSELVDYLGVSRQNLDGVLKRLEALRYVERVEDPSSRRIRLVKMTEIGLNAWNGLFERSFDFYRQCTQDITPANKDDLIDALGKIQHALRALQPSDDNGNRSEL